MRLSLLVLGLCLFSLSCSSTQKKQTTSSSVEDNNTSELPDKSANNVHDRLEYGEYHEEDSFVLESILNDAENQVYLKRGWAPKPNHTPLNSSEEDPRIPVEALESIEKWIQYFTEKRKDLFVRYLKRGHFYKDVVQATLEEHGLPKDLYYLAMIESGFAVRARSHASAVGVWQFMRGTSRRYGLKTNYYIDERKDPVRATEAASKYLKDLYNVFRSWYLAIAAYNSGERRVLGAILNSKTRNYWEISKRRLLPRETIDYVPKFMAAAIVARNLDKFGIEEVSNEPEFPSVELVELPSPLRLQTIGKAANIPISALKELNPHIRRSITPPHSSTYEVWIPVEMKENLVAQMEGLSKQKLKGLKRYSTYGDGTYHVVRRGESLYVIARKYKLSVGFLKRLNGLYKSRIYPGQKIRVASRSYSRKPTRKVTSNGKYKVRRGDNLEGIARKFGISVQQIRRLNAIKGSRIFAGQSLRIN